MNTTKSDSKFKEIFLIVKSGIIGALALTGICIILFIISFAIREPFISHLYSKTFAKCSLKGLFIATTGLGFILGIIARRRLTLKSEIILIAVFSVPLIIGAWMLDAIGMRVSVPHTMKLSDCTNGVLNIHLMVPKGHVYHLELNTPAVQTMPNGTVTSSYKFSGHIRISSKASLVTDFAISSDTAWLIPSGFALTDPSWQNTNSLSLGRFIQSQKDYDIQVTLDPPPPPASSIWLYWVQSRMDMQR